MIKVTQPDGEVRGRPCPAHAENPDSLMAGDVALLRGESGEGNFQVRLSRPKGRKAQRSW
ncbi:hypothetical protein AQJ66_02180 [Streptomyces bungoensis]|uniref:Uncharacterized protein n=1 Tax=Streptomyces bungoensis TaxID=285568 RepID=A0A101TCN2_9ACTN|nr:hypothetical protein AQJ66_02180 [Streptomyces bungoensis]